MFNLASFASSQNASVAQGILRVKLTCNSRLKRLFALLAVVCLVCAGFVAYAYLTESEMERWVRHADRAILDAGARRDVRGELAAGVRHRAAEWFIPLLELETVSQSTPWYFRIYVKAPPKLRALLPMPRQKRPERYSWLMGGMLMQETNSAPFLAALKHESPRVRVAAVEIYSASPQIAAELQSQTLDLLESYTDLRPQHTCARALLAVKNPTEETRDRLTRISTSYAEVDLLLVEVLRKADSKGEWWPGRYASVVEKLAVDPLALAGAARIVQDVKSKPAIVVSVLQQLAKSEHDYVRRAALAALEVP